MISVLRKAVFQIAWPQFCTSDYIIGYFVASVTGQKADFELVEHTMGSVGGIVQMEGQGYGRKVLGY